MPARKRKVRKHIETGSWSQQQLTLLQHTLLILRVTCSVNLYQRARLVSSKCGSWLVSHLAMD